MEELLAIATLLGGITALWFFWDKIAAWATGGKNISSHDAALYEEYKSLLVRNGVADFYSQHDFLGAFREDSWRPLSRYVDGCGIQLSTSLFTRSSINCIKKYMRAHRN